MKLITANAYSAVTEAEKIHQIKVKATMEEGWDYETARAIVGFRNVLALLASIRKMNS